MLRDKAKSGGSTKQGKLKGVALIDSPTRVAPLMNVKDPPPYGAQHRQDALWEGGNEALPPRWIQFKVGDGETEYQDDNLVMISWNRPLPGVRLDEPRQLIHGCEWHISSLGRSYFVNHNTQTTSWKKPVPDRPVGSLTPERIIEGHSECIWSLACVDTGCNIMSASEDGSIRQWIRDGEPVGEPWRSDGGGVGSMAVCLDQTMVVSGSGDGRLRLWNVGEGSMVGHPWKGHSAPVIYLDWSPDAREIASGSEDGTIRRWNLNTRRQIAPPIETGHGWVRAVKYSPRGEKFASCGYDLVIRVWSKDGKLLIEIKGHDDSVYSLCWSKNGAYIFSGSADMTIRKWQSIDGKELVILRGHTGVVTSICLSPDERHLVSASSDYSVRIWDLKTNQQVGNPLLHDDELLALTIPSDGRHIASAGLDKKIYVWSLEAALKSSSDQVSGHVSSSKDIFDVSPLPTRQADNEGPTRHGHEFWGDGTKSTPRRLPTRRGPSPPRRRNFFDFLYFRRPMDVSPSIPHQARRWDFSLFSGRIPAHTIDVAPARDEDRYAVAPPTEAEVAAAMQYAIDHAADSQTSQGQAAAGAPGSEFCTQGQPASQPTQPVQNSSPCIHEPSYEIGCCGFVLHLARRRSTA
ncbi:WD40 repeat-like protein [Rhizopogon salebrosus TDB-379]|nr:WD40 repeat-like protein [Rhizopogon salebrosus TDB-379]